MKKLKAKIFLVLNYGFDYWIWVASIVSVCTCFFGIAVCVDMIGL